MNAAAQAYAQSDKRIEQFVPPEGVPISFAIASLGARLGAQVIDLIFTNLIVSILAFALIWGAVLPEEAAGTLFVLVAFLMRVPYYILSELVWNGRTLGKRIVGIRVINMDGRRLTPHQVVARNLLKEVEFFTPLSMVFAAPAMSEWGIVLTLVWILVVCIVPFANKRRQRLGDIVAGTLVVDNPRTVLLPDLAVSVPTLVAQEEFDFTPAHLETYGRFELQTLEDILRDPTRKPDAPEIATIARTIIKKIAYDTPVKPGRELTFLSAFYRAQREHLETLRLFGTQREDKFHRVEARKL